MIKTLSKINICLHASNQQSNSKSINRQAKQQTAKVCLGLGVNFHFFVFVCLASNTPPYSYALCVIFMILVLLENVRKYSHVVARLPQRLKSMLFEIFSNGDQRSEKKFQTTLILFFEVIVQPPKTHFLTFSSETKIMKITHSA